jgi:hypothetical protein
MQVAAAEAVLVLPTFHPLVV